MWKHLSYQEFEDFFGDLGLTAWVKFNWLAEVPDGYAKVDLGSMGWSTESLPLSGSTDLQYVIKKADNDQVGKLLCSKYTTTSRNDLANEDKSICVNSGGVIVINDSELTGKTYAQIKEYLAGVWLIYKKAE